MQTKRVTSQDVADAAGVSRTTVSLVLNNVQGVKISEATRKRVRESARELGYVPNATAQALATQRARAIGLVMTRSPEQIISDVVLSQLIGGLLTVIKEKKFRLLIEIVNGNADERAYIDLAQAKHIDGMIILTPRTTDIGIHKLDELHIPAVLIGEIPDCNICSVEADDRAAAKKAVQHLIELGHKKIACILNSSAVYHSAQLRLDGYRDALTEAGLPYQEALVRFAHFNPKSGQAAMQSLLDNAEDFSAVFVASDTVALGAIRALREANLHIPNDISLVAFDDIPSAAYTDPPLTTIHIPAAQIATKACEVLLDMIYGAMPEQKKIYLDTDLVIRASTQAR